MTAIERSVRSEARRRDYDLDEPWVKGWIAREVRKREQSMGLSGIAGTETLEEREERVRVVVDHLGLPYKVISRDKQLYFQDGSGKEINEIEFAPIFAERSGGVKYNHLRSKTWASKKDVKALVDSAAAGATEPTPEPTRAPAAWKVDWYNSPEADRVKDAVYAIWEPNSFDIARINKEPYIIKSVYGRSDTPPSGILRIVSDVGLLKKGYLYFNEISKGRWRFEWGPNDITPEPERQLVYEGSPEEFSQVIVRGSVPVDTTPAGRDRTASFKHTIEKYGLFPGLYVALGGPSKKGKSDSEVGFIMLDHAHKTIKVRRLDGEVVSFHDGWFVAREDNEYADDDRVRERERRIDVFHVPMAYGDNFGKLWVVNRITDENEGEAQRFTVEEGPTGPKVIGKIRVVRGTTQRMELPDYAYIEAATPKREEYYRYIDRRKAERAAAEDREAHYKYLIHTHNLSDGARVALFGPTLRNKIPEQRGTIVLNPDEHTISVRRDDGQVVSFHDGWFVVTDDGDDTDGGGGGESGGSPSAGDPGTFYVDRSTGKVHLSFDYDTYQALPGDIRDEIKRYFRWSRRQKEWISKASENTYYAQNIARKAGLVDAGRQGDAPDFAAQQAAKAERAEYRSGQYEERSDAAQERSDELLSRRKKISDMIPFGQPILVGHHSENRARRDAQRMWDLMGRGVEEWRKSEYYQGRAAAAAVTAEKAKGNVSVDFAARRVREAEKSIEKIKGHIVLYATKYNAYLKEGKEAKAREYHRYIQEAEDRLTMLIGKLEWYQAIIDKHKESGKTIYGPDDMAGAVGVAVKGSSTPSVLYSAGPKKVQVFLSGTDAVSSYAYPYTDITKVLYWRALKTDEDAAKLIQRRAITPRSQIFVGLPSKYNKYFLDGTYRAVVGHKRGNEIALAPGDKVQFRNDSRIRTVVAMMQHYGVEDEVFFADGQAWRRISPEEPLTVTRPDGTVHEYEGGVATTSHKINRLLDTQKVHGRRFLDGKPVYYSPVPGPNGRPYAWLLLAERGGPDKTSIGYRYSIDPDTGKANLPSVQTQDVKDSELEAMHFVGEATEPAAEWGNQIEALIRNWKPKQDPEPVDTAETASASIVDMLVSAIKTDPDRFQPRDDFSQEKVDAIVANYDPARFDPLTVWKDVGGTYYVLAGHHRFKAAEQMGMSKVPVRVFRGPEEDAIELAWTSNNLGRQQSDVENAKYLRRMLTEGKKAKEIKDECQRLYDKSCRTVWLLAQLDDDGLATRMLKEFNRGTDAYADAEVMAKWVGSVKEKFPDLSRSQENEIYQFLRENYKTAGRRFRSENEFRAWIDNQLAIRFPMGTSVDPNEVLNLNSQKDTFIREHDEKIREAERELESAKKERDAKLREVLQRDVDEETRKRVMQKFEDAVIYAQRELLRIKDQIGQVQQAARDQTSLFGLGDLAGYTGTITGTAGNGRQTFAQRYDPEAGEYRVSWIREDGYRFPVGKGASNPYTDRDVARLYKDVLAEGWDRQTALFGLADDTDVRMPWDRTQVIVDRTQDPDADKFDGGFVQFAVAAFKATELLDDAKRFNSQIDHALIETLMQGKDLYLAWSYDWQEGMGNRKRSHLFKIGPAGTILDKHEFEAPRDPHRVRMPDSMDVPSKFQRMTLADVSNRGALLRLAAVGGIEAAESEWYDSMYERPMSVEESKMVWENPYDQPERFARTMAIRSRARVVPAGDQYTFDDLMLRDVAPDRRPRSIDWPKAGKGPVLIGPTGRAERGVRDDRGALGDPMPVVTHSEPPTQPERPVTVNPGSGKVAHDVAQMQVPEGLPLEGRLQEFFTTLLPDANILLWGPAGSGKSSFAILLADSLAKTNQGKVLYAMSEERISSGRLRRRMELMKVNPPDNLVFEEITDFDALKDRVNSGQYRFVVVDSVTEIPAEDKRFIEMMKAFPEVSFVLVAQADKTKRHFAGPARLDHAVDTTIACYLDENGMAIARPSKHRDGPPKSMQIFEGQEQQTLRSANFVPRWP